MEESLACLLDTAAQPLLVVLDESAAADDDAAADDCRRHMFALRAIDDHVERVGLGEAARRPRELALVEADEVGAIASS